MIKKLKLPSVEDLKNKVTADVSVDPKRKAYLVQEEGGDVEYLVGAYNSRGAKRVLRERTEKAGRKLLLRDIRCERAKDRDYIAKLPRASWPHWYLGYKNKQTGEEVGWFAPKRSE